MKRNTIRKTNLGYIQIKYNDGSVQVFKDNVPSTELIAYMEKSKPHEKGDDLFNSTCTVAKGDWNNVPPSRILLSPDTDMSNEYMHHRARQDNITYKGNLVYNYEPMLIKILTEQLGCLRLAKKLVRDRHYYIRLLSKLK